MFGRGGAFVRGECGQIGCDKCRATRSFANINQHAVSSRVSSDYRYVKYGSGNTDQGNMV